MVQGKNEVLLRVDHRILLNSAAGDVDLALDNKTNTKIAIKRMLWSKQPRKELIVSEIHVMKNFRFRSIVNFLDCYLRPNELWSKFYSFNQTALSITLILDFSCNGIYEWGSIDTNC